MVQMHPKYDAGVPPALICKDGTEQRVASVYEGFVLAWGV
jgi:hypothetical protein